MSVLVEGPVFARKGYNILCDVAIAPLLARLYLSCFALLIILPALVVDDVVNDRDWDSVLIYRVSRSKVYSSFI